MGTVVSTTDRHGHGLRRLLPINVVRAGCDVASEVAERVCGRPAKPFLLESL